MAFLNSVMEKSQSASNSIPENEKHIDALQKREDEIIDTILSLGYDDPRKDKDQSASLYVDGYKYFIKGFLILSIDDIEESNIRSVTLDKTWAETELVEKFERRKQELGGGPGIQFLPFLCDHEEIEGKYRTYVGHHRVWAQHVYREDGKVAALILTRPIIIEKNMTYVTIPSQVAVLSKIRSNPRMDSLQMTTKCAKIALQDMYATDPTFGGRNPSGQKPPRRSDSCFDFDDLMDWIWKPTNNFLHDKTRSRIYNLWINGGPASKLLNTSDEANITSHLVTLGLNAGLNKNGNRVKFLDHFDEKTNSIVIQCDDNGGNFYYKVAKFLVEWISDCSKYRDLLSEKKLKYISVVGRVYDPPVSLKGVKERREKFVEHVFSIDKLIQLSTKGAFRINLIAMPPELKNDKDKGFIWKLDNS